MLGMERSEQVLDGEVLPSSRTSSTDLVPVNPSMHDLPKRPLTHPDASFLAQLIATAAQAPQTCKLRRATPADAQSAYGHSAAPQERRGVLRRTRRVI
jgi:hypothetical protein